MALMAKPYSEMYIGDSAARPHYLRYVQWLTDQAPERLTQKRAEADALFHRVGIPFAVYGQEEGAERLIPFDIVPRVLPHEEWIRLETGLKQRVRALNAFIHDIYHDQQILKAGVVPAEQVLCNSQYRPEMQGVDVPGGIYVHIAGIDIVRDDDGEFLVLEDNLRVPSGVSYMLENRKMMMRLFPELFSGHCVAPTGPGTLHCAADLGAVHLPHLRGSRSCATPHRLASLRAFGARRHHRPRRPHPCRPARRLAGGQLLPGRRHQRHLGPGNLVLSRTADHLYWMSRYIERAESLARLVDAHYRMSLLPHSPDALAQSLSSTMTALQMEQAYKERHDAIEPRAVFEFVSLDRDYSGSIFSCLRAARENARAVRGSLTSKLWETLNSTWLDVRSQISRRAASPDIGQFVEWVKERSHLTRGVTIGTMMRDEAFHFTRIGTFLERADSTARILTAHQSDLIPGADASEVPDPYECSVLLRCCKEAYTNLKSVANEQSAETERRAGEMHAMLHFTRMEEIVDGGLPRFLEQFLGKVRDLGDRNASDFLLPPAEA